MAPTQHELTDEQLFCLEGCRGYKQYHGMSEAFESDTDETKSCIFCNLNRERNEVVWEDDLVAAWHVHDDFMRDELAIHLIIIPKRHMRFVADLTDKEIVSILHAVQFLKEEFNYQGGLFHARQGDMRLNAGTVPHLHFNDFQPDPHAITSLSKHAQEDEKAEVRVPVYKDPRDRQKNIDRAARFAGFYEKGVTPDEFSRLLKGNKVTKDGVDLVGLD
ncbi:MAG: diadenosine tetraphosphate (Ap4A) HIT family hydrolase [Acidimicrobiales bacterium]|jgi:diadenosine tetraphosphate (Ap4A) HIT family hydrolase